MENKVYSKDSSRENKTKLGEGGVGRVFITGVTDALNDFTSGFNLKTHYICKNF
jgi:hypothetical protein